MITPFLPPTDSNKMPYFYSNSIFLNISLHNESPNTDKMNNKAVITYLHVLSISSSVSIYFTFLEKSHFLSSSSEHEGTFLLHTVTMTPEKNSPVSLKFHASNYKTIKF